MSNSDGSLSPENNDSPGKRRHRWHGPSIQSMCLNPMTSENYLIWRSQFEGVLRMHHLMPFVKRTLPIPSKKLRDGSDNPNYEDCMYKDDVILGWIKSIFSAPVQRNVHARSTALEAWTILEREWSPTNPTHIQTLRNEMKALKKTTDFSMKEYLLKYKGLKYFLQDVGYKSLDDDMIIEMVLDGLTPNYRMFRSTLHGKN